MITYLQLISHRIHLLLYTALLLFQFFGRMADADMEGSQPQIILHESRPTSAFNADELLNKHAAYLSEHGDERPAYFDVIYRDNPDMTIRLEYAGMLRAKALDEKSLRALDEAINQYKIAATERPGSISIYNDMAHAYVERAMLSFDTWTEDHEKAIEAIDKCILLLPALSAKRKELQDWRAMLIDASMMQPIRAERPEPMNRLTGETPSMYGLDSSMDAYEFSRLVYNPQPVRDEELKRLDSLKHAAETTAAPLAARLEYALELIRVGKRTSTPALLMEAEGILRMAAETEPNNAVALAGLSLYNLAVRAYEPALRFLEEARSLKPDMDIISEIEETFVVMRETFRIQMNHVGADPLFRHVAKVAFERLDAILISNAAIFTRLSLESN